ncbi:MAG: DUF2332 family protein [Pseudomonadota bacterium]
MTLPKTLRQVFEAQGEACRRLGSPFTGRVCHLLLDVIGEGALGAQVRDWPGDPVDDALALRLCGAFHALARSGHALAAVYPPAEVSDADLSAALRAAVSAEEERLIAGIASAPQTNEVARSSIILGGLLTVAEETGLPIDLLEIGASAGVNLFPDRFHYVLGEGVSWGDPASPVSIESRWTGQLPPLDTPLRIGSRAGCDLAPISAADPAARDRMLAYIWPDQAARLARAEAALTLAADAGLSVETSGAADWLDRRLPEPQGEGRARVLFHTIMWQYMPEAEKARIRATLEAAGAAATASHPFAWLRLEPDEARGSAAIDLTLWPGGETRRLGRGDFHGRFAEWA